MMSTSYETLPDSEIKGNEHLIQQRLKRWKVEITLEAILKRSSFTGAESTGSQLISILEYALSSGFTLQKSLNDGSREKCTILQKRMHSLYGIFVALGGVKEQVAAEYGFKEINPKELENYSLKTFSEEFRKNNIVDAVALGKPELHDELGDVDKVIAAYAHFLKCEQQQGKYLALNTFLFFSKLKTDLEDYLVRQMKNIDVKNYCVVLQERKVKIGDTIYAGFSVSKRLTKNRHKDDQYAAEQNIAAEEERRTNEEKRVRQQQREERRSREKIIIVGNEVALEQIDGLVHTIGAYDTAVQANALLCHEEARPVSMLLYGSPGSGKSMLVKYAGKRLASLAQAKGITYREVVVDNSFQDEFHGRDVKNLKAKIDEIEDPSALGIFVLDDIDGIIQSRNARDHSQLEAKSLHMIMQWLDGIETEYKGNYLIIATTNFPEKIDSALRSRFTEEIEIVGPQTAEQYATLMKSKMNGTGTYMQLSQEEYVGVGKVMLERGYSGRDVHNLTMILNRSINNTSAIPEEFFLLPYDVQVQKLPTIRKTLSLSDLQKTMEAYKQ